MNRNLQIAVLAALVLVLAWVIVGSFSDGPASSNAATRTARTSPATTTRERNLSVPKVDLALLAPPEGTPALPGRDLFGYFVPPPPPPPTKTPEELAEEARRRKEAAEQQMAENRRRREEMAARPALPEPPPPIRLKFEGFVEKEGVKYAILRDDDLITHVGKEGDTIMFRFKILKINHESIEMGYVDNPGVQHIDITGS
ncbi:MAG: hypothetical protein U0166_04650 [Acidobacteriota bacterium]